MESDKGQHNSQGNSFSNGPTAVTAVRHDEFCACQWCLQGVR